MTIPLSVAAIAGGLVAGPPARASAASGGQGGAPASIAPVATPPPVVPLPLGGPWSFRRVARANTAAEPWRPATVPGCVHTDLFANGKIGDPFYRLNEKDQQGIERESWEYRTTFRVDSAARAQDHVDLVYQGLNTYAEVFLNGVSVLWATNMFRTWRVDVKGQLTDGDNVLVVRFRSPIEHVKPLYDSLGYRLPAVNDQAPEMVSMFTRKAPYHYGWDWGPRFVTSGIWRPVTLEPWSGARLDDVQIFQDHLDASVARLHRQARVQAARAGQARIEAALPDEAGSSPVAVDVPVKPGTSDVQVALQIDKPERWWPSGRGAQRRYTVETRLGWDGVPRGVRRTKIGLRTIEVVHRRDDDGGKPGKSFTIRVNGAPVFMKGANWVPADRFYDIADELGLLVWQDFMFACSMYPGDAAFVENVRREAIENVRRLRNHPSLALWAGNNELEATWPGWG